MAKVRKSIKAILITLGVIIVLPFVVYGSVALVLTPSRLTGIVNNYSNKYLKAKVQVDTVRLSLFSELPYIGVKLSNGSIISEVFKDTPDSLRGQLSPRADSLMHFKEIMVSLSLPDLIRSKIDIRRLRVVEPNVYAYVAPWGAANWEVYPFDETEEVDDGEGFEININRISVRGAKRIAYNNRQDLYYVNAELGSLFLRGNITTSMDNLDIERLVLRDFGVILSLEPEKFAGRVIIDTLRVSGNNTAGWSVDADSKLSMVVDDFRYLSRFPVELKGLFKPNFEKGNIVDIDEGRLALGGMPIFLDGRVGMVGDSIISTLICKVDSLSLGGFLKQLPEESFPELHKIKTSIEMEFMADVVGSYDMETGRLPRFTIDFGIPGGALSYEGVEAAIRNVALDATLFHNPISPDSTGVRLRSFNLTGSGINVDAKGMLSNILIDPKFDGELSGDLIMDSLLLFMPELPMGMEATGKVSLSAKADLKMSDLELSKIGNTRIRGRLDTDSLYINIPSENIKMIAGGGRVSLGATENRRDSTITIGEQMLRISVGADTLHVNYKDEIVVDGSKMRVSIRSTASVVSGDTSKVHPLSGFLQAERFRMATVDSMWVNVRDFKSDFSLRGSPRDASIPVMNLKGEIGRLMYRDAENRMSLSQAALNIDATERIVKGRSTRDRGATRVGSGSDRELGGGSLTEEQMEQVNIQRSRRAKMLDSLQLLYPDTPRDSLIAVNRRIQIEARENDELRSGDIDFSVDQSIKDIFNKWNVEGNISAKSGRLSSPYFPVRNRLSDMDLDFTMDKISLNSFKIATKQSSMGLSGEISNIRRTIVGRGGTLTPLKVNIDIVSDSLNFNEIIRAASSMMAYMDMSDEEKEELSKESDDNLEKTLMEQGSDELSLIIVPANIDLTLSLLVKKAQYDSLSINMMRGGLIARDRVLMLDDFGIFTNAGVMVLSALYATQSKENIQAGFDMEFTDIEIEEFIKLVPVIDSLFPMLRSLEGLVNCELAAATQLDTNMNLILPSLDGVCRIKGEHLVLLDGETFTEIAKMARFKNKDRNIVDSIKIEVLIKDNKLEIFPFIMSMDRYEAGVSGIHHFDMSFDYHISVIKSPLPIKIGLNVTGDLDDFKVRIGKVLYKNRNIPMYSEIIDDRRINLQSIIMDYFAQ